MTDDEDTDPNGRAPQRPARPRSPYESGDRRGDTTSPIDLLERDLDPADAELAGRLRETDPAVLAVRLAKELSRDRRDRRRDKHDSNELENTVARAIASQDGRLGAVEADVRDLKRGHATAQWVIRAAIAGSFAVLAYVAEKIWTSAEREGELRIRMQHNDRAIDRLERAHERESRPDRVPKDNP